MHRVVFASFAAVVAVVIVASTGATATAPSTTVSANVVGDTPPAAPVPPAAPTKRSWSVDRARSSFVLQVFKEGAAAALAHDHVVNATKYTANLSADPTNPTSASIDVTVQTAALDNDDPAVRKQFNLPLNVSDRDREKVLEAMRGDEVLDVERFPTIVFRSTAVEAAADGKLTLKGNLTLHGVTRAVAMPFSARVTGDTIDAQARFPFKTSEFGMPPYSALLGAVRCKDDVVLNLHVVAVAK